MQTLSLFRGCRGAGRFSRGNGAPARRRLATCSRPPTEQHRLPAVAVNRPERIPIRGIVRATRPKQFLKNGIVFAAFIFTVGLAWKPQYPESWLPLLAKALVAFVAFCAVCGAEYIVNDVCDRESDRFHPRKRLRPIATGELAPGTAMTAACLLFALGAMLGLQLGPRFSTLLFAYGTIMVGYSYRIKHIVILDVLTIAVGFVLRAAAGAIAINVPISPWLYLCTILGALLLAVNKRRYELLLLQAGASEHRPILSEYTTQLLDQMSATVTASTVIAYSFYTFSADSMPKNHVMMATIPFVLYGLFRYLHLVHRRDEGGSPDELLTRDVPLIACMKAWGLTAGTLLALFR